MLVANRRREHFAVRNVSLAPARDDRNALDRKLQLGAGRHDAHAIGGFHPLDQRLLGFLHRRVVGRADVEVKIFERGRAHVGRLGERVGRIAQHDPLGLRDANIGVDRLPPMLLVQVHLLLRHVGELAAVGRAANADVGLHLLHPRSLQVAGQLHALLGRRLIERPQHGVRLPRHERHRPALRRPFDQPANEGRLRQIEGLDEHLFAALDAATMVQKQIGKRVDAWVVHGSKGSRVGMPRISRDPTDRRRDSAWARPAHHDRLLPARGTTLADDAESIDRLDRNAQRSTCRSDTSLGVSMTTESPLSDQTQPGTSFAETALTLGGKSADEARRTGAIDTADDQVEALFAPQYQTVNSPAHRAVWDRGVPVDLFHEHAAEDAARCAAGDGRFDRCRPAARGRRHAAQRRRQNCRIRCSPIWARPAIGACWSTRNMAAPARRSVRSRRS